MQWTPPPKVVLVARRPAVKAPTARTYCMLVLQQPLEGGLRSPARKPVREAMTMVEEMEGVEMMEAVCVMFVYELKRRWTKESLC